MTQPTIRTTLDGGLELRDVLALDRREIYLTSPEYKPMKVELGQFPAGDEVTLRMERGWGGSVFVLGPEGALEGVEVLVDKTLAGTTNQDGVLEFVRDQAP
ncbi:MAG: hypothetical protein ACJAZN_002311 [Planctomycetota bacterium]